MFGQLKELTEALQAPAEVKPKDKFISDAVQMFEKFIFEVSSNFDDYYDGSELFEVLTSLNGMFGSYGLNMHEKRYLKALENLCIYSSECENFFEV